MMLNNYFNIYFNKISARLQSIDFNDLENAASRIIATVQNRGKIIVIGNGGSAAMASHVEVVLPKLQGFEPSILTKQI